jgi:hypothetical protein
VVGKERDGVTDAGGIVAGAKIVEAGFVVPPGTRLSKGRRRRRVNARG